MRTDCFTLVWDWNGTLLDDISSCIQAVNVMLSDRNLPVIDENRYRDVFRFPVKDYYRDIGFDIDKEDWDGICERFHDLYAVYSQSSCLREGTIDTLNRFRESGIEMFVLSACHTSILQSMARERKVSNFFSNMIGLSNLHAHSKAELGIEFIKETRRNPGKTLLVGDTTHDWEVAKEMGCMCVLMTGGHESTKRLSRCGCPLVSGMKELEDFIFNSVLRIM